MSTPTKINFKVYQGSTFSEVLRWETSKIVYKNIAGITKAAPAVVNVVAHAVPDGWRVKITNVSGMKEINDSENFRVATVKTVDTIELNAVNAAGYTTYTSGGVLEYYEPKDLTGYTARMQIREKIDSTTTIDELTTENGKISIDTVNKTITLTISATATAAYTFGSAVYSLEMISSGGVVVPFANGTLTLVKEVTR